MSNQGLSKFSISSLIFGFGFLYVPILILIVYSFNDSRLVTVWSGFSFKSYVELFEDQQILNAAWLSLKIAFLCACMSLILGLMASLALVRFGRFRGHLTFAGMITAPLVMPEVITGLSLLLLFVAMEQALGWPAGRGMLTIFIAHVTFSTAFVTVILSSRLREVDRSIEEAAMDLGASPLKVFFVITLPIISPALLAAWLLGFTLSLDDLVIASFVSGPGSTTLPMKVFSSVRLGVSPKINALATIIIFLVSFGVLLAGWLSLRWEKKRKLETLQLAAESSK
ncbi:MAG: ABC transporter permease subunit [SAR324 cluster bacterium]|jgi:putrescine transport system permease protein|nr:ABC transporter permease subunit [SAR324 cluster bacterium]MCH2265831.1 ABC transporter permease subunit [SAR324 cluster bacterium]